MNGPQHSQPVIVTFRQVEKAFSSVEAVPQILEAAQRDAQVSPLERAAAAAAIGNVLNALRRAETKSGALVLTTAQDGAASRLQSLIASGEGARLTFASLPAGGEEAQFDTGDWIGWAQVAWEKLKHPRRHAMLRPESSVPEKLPDVCRIAVFGDWATGLYGAPRIAQSIKNDPDPLAMVLHLGDVYYSGTKSETESRFLDLWPRRADAVSRALNGNHEMYSGGDAYFGVTLPRFGQRGSYFAFQNKHWTLVGLDVAYVDHAIDDAQVAWLEAVLAQAGDRRLVLFSHHQLYSHFESQGHKLWNHPRFGAILRSKRVFAWYWGHEHRCTLFERPDPAFGLFGRCIGHGGMPQSRKPTRELPRATGTRFERADWRRSVSRVEAGHELPDCVVLEGANPFILGEEEKFSPHGYAVLTLDGPRLREQMLDPTGKILYDEILAE